jgi:hypothetical protein
MDANFLVDGDPIGAGLGERGNEFVRSFNHEMTGGRDVDGPAKWRPDRDVRDEMTIHHVDVKNSRSSSDGVLCLCAERGPRKEWRVRA